MTKHRIAQSSTKFLNRTGLKDARFIRDTVLIAPSRNVEAVIASFKNLHLRKQILRSEAMFLEYIE